jgi:cell wall-active antibiotic response 4TMS protein YvqF
MSVYIRNRNCPCLRCRTHSLMGAAILITLGVLFLLENYGVVPFERSFPVLLLVIGAVLLISRTGSTEGHLNPQVYVPAPAVSQMAVQTPQQWPAGVTAPPPDPTQPPDSQVKP